MSNIRRAKRIDENQPDIVKALRDAGASVYILGDPLDLLISAGEWKTMLIEIKNPRSRYGRAGLNDKQEEFKKGWQGAIAQVSDVTGALNALALLRAA